MPQLTDTVTILTDGVRRTADGYLVANARVARTGIQLYTAAEIGLTDRDPNSIVRVYRSEDEVFNQDSLRSYAHRPVTINHPPVAVDASNWRDHSVGQTGDEVARDGDFVRVPLVLMDEDSINRVQDGQRQLSMGYACQIEMKDGTTPDGEKYDAVQKNLRMNHLAVVALARGGSKLKIGDKTSQETQRMADPITTQTVLVDGLQVLCTDQSAVAINTLQERLSAQATDHAIAIAAKDSTIAEKDKALGAKDAEIETLKGQVLSDADLDKLVAARATLVDAAKRHAPDLKTDGLSNSDIRKAVVKAKMGDNFVDGKSDDYVQGLFDTLSVDTDPVRNAINKGAAPLNTSDADTIRNDARSKMLENLSTGYMGGKQEGVH